VDIINIIVWRHHHNLDPEDVTLLKFILSSGACKFISGKN